MGLFSDLDGGLVGGPSILAADFARLADDVRKARDGGAAFVHFDTMDNHYVPNLSFGPPVAASLVSHTDLPIDVHLMVENPDNLIPDFLGAGVASISVHPEAVTHLHRTLAVIRDGGAEAGVALNPTTPPEALEWTLLSLDFVLVLSVDPGFGGQSFLPEAAEKIRRLKEMTGLPIAVDGGITVETAPVAAQAGANALVAGSAVFKGDPATEMRRIIEAGRGHAER
jgi:ribulose-phosphate 3-epimerase